MPATQPDSPAAPPMPPSPLSRNPGLWRGSDLQDSEDWIFRFPPESLTEIRAALAAVQARGLNAPAFGKADFPLPKFSTVLAHMLEELENGRGFFLMRGFPVTEFTEAECEIIFWGLGQHLGIPLSQNAEGHELGHVRNLGLDINKTNVRAYQTTAELIFHNDQSDVIMLMCLKAARSGGQSRLVSVTAIQNEIQRRRPDLLEELYKPFYIDRRGERGREDEGDEPFYAMPVLSYHKGLVTVRYIRGYIESAQRFPEVPRLTPRQIEALDLFDAIANEPGMALAFQMEPGDFQLANNFCVLHSRTNFEDWPELKDRRHLLRLWVSAPNSRELPPCFETRFGTCEGGKKRGGIPPRAEAGVAVKDQVQEFRLEKV
ncbi:MAG: TauD/TfdA family dioxygenase [Betaproteobacteria bacterium]